jgi:hypothetical protein
MSACRFAKPLPDPFLMGFLQRVNFPFRVRQRLPRARTMPSPLVPRVVRPRGLLVTFMAEFPFLGAPDMNDQPRLMQRLRPLLHLRQRPLRLPRLRLVTPPLPHFLKRPFAPRQRRAMLILRFWVWPENRKDLERAAPPMRPYPLMVSQRSVFGAQNRPKRPEISDAGVAGG